MQDRDSATSSSSSGPTTSEAYSFSHLRFNNGKSSENNRVESSMRSAVLPQALSRSTCLVGRRTLLTLLSIAILVLVGLAVGSMLLQLQMGSSWVEEGKVGDLVRRSRWGYCQLPSEDASGSKRSCQFINIPPILHLQFINKIKER